MNILVPDSWLREYLDTNANPTQIKDCLSLCGPSVEKVVKQGNDYIYHIEITSNRVDMASILGFAGEAMAILPRFGIKARFRENITLVWRDIRIKPKKEFPLHVTISNPNLCPRFAAIILENIKMGDSPAIIRDRLTKSGIRPLSNVVDVSNYLMRLFGQPVHTFDYDKIKHAVMIMRESKKGEKIATLDGKTFTLPGGDIIVEDGDGRLIDLCGIMGGENSCVSAETKRVLLFVQTYDPIHIRRTSMVLSQRTEASSLF